MNDTADSTGVQKRRPSRSPPCIAPYRGAAGADEVRPTHLMQDDDDFGHSGMSYQRSSHAQTLYSALR